MPAQNHDPKATPPPRPAARRCSCCGAEQHAKPIKPRDVGLLLWCLLHRVPVEVDPLTEQWIEVARKHVRMSPERLAEIRTGPLHVYWDRMLEKRARRLAYFREHGYVPPRWTPLEPGEQDRSASVLALRLYWKRVRPIIAKMRKHPDTQQQKLMTRYLHTKRLKAKARKLAALGNVLVRLAMQWEAQTGKLTLQDYLAFARAIIEDRPKAKRAPAQMGLAGETPRKNAREQHPAEVVSPGLQEGDGNS